jgi:hypothetical protein
MNRIEKLVEKYTEHISTPWPKRGAGIQRVLFVVYNPHEELRLRVYLPEFELRTKQAGYHWRLEDLTNSFPEWLSAHRYKEKYFARPQLMDGYQHGVIEEFTEDLTEQIADTLDQADDKTVFALSGVGTLFGVSSVSTVVEKLAPKVYGRLVVFFPGQVENNNYRLLDARDGWNYLAVNITAA